MTARSVIVVSHRPGDWLEGCLASALRVADDVVVVDNASEGYAAAAAAQRLGARSLRSPRNLGFAGGVAAGLQLARGDIVGVLNDDAVAGDTWMDSAADALADPTVAAVTPKVVLAEAHLEVVLDDEVWHNPGDPRPLGRQITSVTVDGVELLGRCVGVGLHRLEAGAGTQWRWTAGPVPWYVPVRPGSAGPVLVDGVPVPSAGPVALLNHAGSTLRPDGGANEIGYATPDDGRFDRPAEVFGFSGTAPVFRADTLARLGGFATPYFAYNEDTDWCLRAQLAGMKILYDPGGRVEHRRSATSGGSDTPLVQVLARRNAALCLVRTAPWPIALPRLRHGLTGAAPGVRRGFARLLPWAVGTRLAMARGWQLSPGEVWGRWLGAGAEWDRGPARPPQL